ncbi:MAG TPA: XRE family transcriptional regulator [Lactobacillus sp.]|nr:XRE family transcriptional regulator [Lactobacillus sp.]
MKEVDVINEKVLGHFLRYKRTTADIANFAVSQTRSRRTPGLTREEVADLANISTDWYTRIEQGRTGSIPSGDVLAALCRVLQLTAAETDYAFNLTGLRPPAQKQPDVSEQLSSFIADLSPRPAYIMDQQLTILAANATYQRLFNFDATQPSLKRNLVWRTFNDPEIRSSLINWEQVAQYLTAVFRNHYSQSPDSKFLYQVFQSVNQDPTFLSVWNTLTVTNFEPQRLFFQTETHQELYLVENTFEVPATHQFIVIENAADAATRNHLAHIETETSS